MSEFKVNKATGRVAETTLGIIGSIFGMLLSSIGTAFEAEDSGSIMGLGVAVIITCFITLILSCIINKNRVVMGVLLVIGGILNFVFISMFGILSGILILVAGILALIRK